MGVKKPGLFLSLTAGYLLNWACRGMGKLDVFE